MDLFDIFETVEPTQVNAPKTNNSTEGQSSTAKWLGDKLPETIRQKANAAAEAHDSATAASGALQQARSQLQKELDLKLASLVEQNDVAQNQRIEAIKALQSAMEEEKITKIPMSERPDITIKVTKGGKKRISKTWLVNPENVVVKSFEAALKGEKTFASGKEAAEGIWSQSPKNDDKTAVVISDRYDDEPDGV